MSQAPAVCIFAGHSGGHLYPALAFAESFRTRFPESRLFLVTSRKALPLVEKMPAGVFNGTDYLNDFPFPAGFSMRTLEFLAAFLRAFFLSWGILGRRKPDLCAGFGSYVSFPGMMLAAVRRIPTLIHEQNKVPGKATRMLMRHVDGAAESFEGSFKLGDAKRIFFTGLPVRQALRNGLKGFVPKALRPSDGKSFELLVTGGSQGAHRLNELVLESFSLLTREELKKIAVTHITGKADFEAVRNAYGQKQIRAEILAFSNHMDELYRKMDAAVTRAGANTVTELALFGIPAVLVPYPHADGHQEENARHLAGQGAACYHPEGTLSAEWLAARIREFSGDAELRRKTTERLAGFGIENSGERLVEAACTLLRRG